MRHTSASTKKRGRESRTGGNRVARQNTVRRKRVAARVRWRRQVHRDARLRLLNELIVFTDASDNLPQTRLGIVHQVAGAITRSRSLHTQHGVRTLVDDESASARLFAT